MLSYILNTVRELCKENFYWIWGLNQDPTAADTVCDSAVLFVLDLLRLYCEEAHSEALMDPSQSADMLKLSTLSLPAASVHSSKLYEG